MKEVQAAARTRGIDLKTELFDQTLAFSKGLGDFKPSMLQDLEAGKPLEYDALNGFVMRLLERAGEQAPINRVFHGTLSFLDNKASRGGLRLTHATSTTDAEDDASSITHSRRVFYGSSDGQCSGQ